MDIRVTCNSVASNSVASRMRRSSSEPILTRESLSGLEETSKQGGSSVANGSVLTLEPQGLKIEHVTQKSMVPSPEEVVQRKQLEMMTLNTESDKALTDLYEQLNKLIDAGSYDELIKRSSDLERLKDYKDAGTSETLLHKAVRRGNSCRTLAELTKFIAKLIELDYSFEIKNKQGQNPLMLALFTDYADGTEAFLSGLKGGKGYDAAFYAVDGNGWGAERYIREIHPKSRAVVTEAQRSHRLKLVAPDIQKAALASMYKVMSSEIHTAIQTTPEDTKLFKTLMKVITAPEAFKDRTNETFSFDIIGNRRIEAANRLNLIRVLTEIAAFNLTKQNESGQNLVMLACGYGDADIIDLLALIPDFKEALYQTDKNGYAAIHYLSLAFGLSNDDLSIQEKLQAIDENKRRILEKLTSFDPELISFPLAREEAVTVSSGGAAEEGSISTEKVIKVKYISDLLQDNGGVIFPTLLKQATDMQTSGGSEDEEFHECKSE